MKIKYISLLILFSLCILSTYAAVPVVSNVAVKGESGYSYQAEDAENLTVSYTVSDGDGDPIINITDWRINGTSIAILNMPFENTSLGGGGGGGTVVATGGTITYSGSYTIHTFLTDDTFNVTTGGNIEYLVVAGGGGGGEYAGGGGGAGGVLHNASYAVTSQEYIVTIGDGGDPGSGTGTDAVGTKGEDTIFGALTAEGGGYGGSETVGGDGGSGGGAGGQNHAGGTGEAGQGNDGAATGANQGGGGGGGAGEDGFTSPSNQRGGAGGDGTSAYSDLLIAAGAGEDVGGVHYIAGGGGGASAATAGGVGGDGGGGDGNLYNNAIVDPPANMGGGGGGTWYNNVAGHGGSGIVIIRYLTPSAPTSNAVKDYSSMGKLSTVVGATYMANSGHDKGGAYSFNGTNHITINSSTYDILKTDNIGSVSVWINFTTGDVYNEIFAYGGTGIVGIWELGLRSSAIDITIQHTGKTIYLQGPTLTAGKWYHIVLTTDGSTWRMYVNGVEETLSPGSGSNEGDWFSDITPDISAPGYMSIGEIFYGGSWMYGFKGFIDDIKIYNRTLSLEEILLLNRSINNILSANETIIGDNVEACITPNDKSQDGTTVCSLNNTIVTNIVLPPTPTVEVKGESGFNYQALDSENLTGTWSNFENGTISPTINITDWRINGVSLTALNLPFESHSASATLVQDYSTWNTQSSVTSATYSANSGHDKGGAYEFGTNGWHIIVNGTAKDRMKTDNIGSISLWINYSSSGAYNCMYCYGSQSAVGIWAFGLRGGKPDITTQKVGELIYLQGPDILTTNVWHHIVLTSDGSTWRMYVNGVSKALTGTGANTGHWFTDLTASMSAPEYMSIGEFYYGGSWMFEFDGYIDDVKVYNRTLSQNEILFLNASMNNKISADETLISENWSMCLTPNNRTQDGSMVCSINNTIMSSFPVANTCTYSGSGNWNVNCSDNCVQNTNLTVNGNLTTFDTGNFTINATLNFSIVNSYIFMNTTTNSCSVYIKGPRGSIF